MKKAPVVLVGIVLAAILFIMAAALSSYSQEGVTKDIPGTAVMFDATRQSASMADWYTAKVLHISGESGNVVVATKYGSTYRLKDIYNNAGSTATVKFVCRNVSTDTVTMKIAEYGHSGKLPPILTIVQTGTSDSLVLFFQLSN